MKCDYLSPEACEARERAIAAGGATPGDLRMVMDPFLCRAMAEWEAYNGTGVIVRACAQHLGLVLPPTRHSVAPLAAVTSSNRVYTFVPSTTMTFTLLAY